MTDATLMPPARPAAPILAAFARRRLIAFAVPLAILVFIGSWIPLVGAVVTGAIGVLVALFAWELPPFAGGDETTNNAYVRGRTTVVSPQVAGYLVEVPVDDFQRVEKGELLARIDALEQARQHLLLDLVH